MDFGSGNRSKEPFGSSIALGMIEKLSAVQKSAHEQSEIPVVLPVESGESIIKLEPNLTTFENEDHKNGASCPICGKTFSQEWHKTFFSEHQCWFSSQNDYKITSDLCSGCFLPENIDLTGEIPVGTIIGKSKYIFKNNSNAILINSSE